MFGNIFKAFSTGKRSAEISRILMKTYSLSVSRAHEIELINSIVESHSNTLNEHELAVQFLAEFSRTMKTDHPQASKELTKYIRMSKGAYSRGLAQKRQPQEELYKVARERFGIEPNSIEGA